MKSGPIKHFCFGDVFLLVVLSMSAFFSYWVIATSDDDQVHDILAAHDKLVVKGKRVEAFNLLNEALAEKEEGPLDPIWLELVRVNTSGYERLGYYLRILAGDPDREETYSEIANFIELAPKVFHDEVKKRYLTDMSETPGVHRDWLEEYGLIMSADES